MGDRLARTLLRVVSEDEPVVQISTCLKDVGVCAGNIAKRRLVGAGEEAQFGVLGAHEGL